MKKRNSILLVVVIAVAILFAIWMTEQATAPSIEPEDPSSEANVTNFLECEAAGNPVMESYPRQCRHGDETFTEDIGNELDKMDLIRIDSPRPNAVIESPLTVIGQARGTWFFEASFPVVLVDWDGLIIAEGNAATKADWMTEEFVPFEAELIFAPDPNVYSNRGTLILRKDNPSGLPEHDDALEVPVLIGAGTR
jgi:hypothetical protein